MLKRYLWPALVWSIIVLILTLIPGDAIPDVKIFQVDKLVHFFIFGVLMVLSAYGLKNVGKKDTRLIHPLTFASTYSIAFGIIIEFIQQYVPGRGFSVADMLANAIGVVLGYFMFIFLQKRNLV